MPSRNLESYRPSDKENRNAFDVGADFLVKLPAIRDTDCWRPNRPSMQHSMIRAFDGLANKMALSEPRTAPQTVPIVGFRLVAAGSRILLWRRHFRFV
jgi:hypothetical protein